MSTEKETPKFLMDCDVIRESKSDKKPCQPISGTYCRAGGRLCSKPEYWAGDLLRQGSVAYWSVFATNPEGAGSPWGYRAKEKDRISRVPVHEFLVKLTVSGFPIQSNGTS